MRAGQVYDMSWWRIVSEHIKEHDVDIKESDFTAGMATSGYITRGYGTAGGPGRVGGGWAVGRV